MPSAGPPFEPRARSSPGPASGTVPRPPPPARPQSAGRGRGPEAWSARRLRRGALLAGGLWAAAALCDGALLAVFLRSPSDAHLEETAAKPDAGPACLGDLAGLEAPGEPRLKPPPGTAPAQAVPEWRLGSDAPKAAPVRREELPALIHVVSAGDTLIGVARGYLGPGADWRAIAAENSLESPYLLQVGRELRIPAIRVARTAVRAELRRPVESTAELRLRAALEPDVNSPPEGAFAPPEPGLRLAHPLREAFPWGLNALAAAAFAAVLLAAGLWALSGLEARADLRGASAALFVGALASAGALAVWWAPSVLMAAWLSRSKALQLAWAAATGALCGAAAGLGAWLGPLASAKASESLGRRFGAAAAGGVSAAAALASLAGWADAAFESLRLPG